MAAPYCSALEDFFIAHCVYVDPNFSDLFRLGFTVFK